jgi:hypothetical protein
MDHYLKWTTLLKQLLRSAGFFFQRAEKFPRRWKKLTALAALLTAAA